MNRLESIIESLIFLNGEPLKLEEISKGLEISIEQVEDAVASLCESHKSYGGIRIIKVEDAVQMCTSPDNEKEVMDFFKPVVKKDLSTSAIETLSIIAYKQPVTRVEIEDIRRVQCSYILKYLQAHRLVKVVGKKNAVGHPSLYGTTDEFLRMIGIESLSNLPKLEEEDVIETI